MPGVAVGTQAVLPPPGSPAVPQRARVAPHLEAAAHAAAAAAPDGQPERAGGGCRGCIRVGTLFLERVGRRRSGGWVLVGREECHAVVHGDVGQHVEEAALALPRRRVAHHVVPEDVEVLVAVVGVAAVHRGRLADDGGLGGRRGRGGRGGIIRVGLGDAPREGRDDRQEGHEDRQDRQGAAVDLSGVHGMHWMHGMPWMLPATSCIHPRTIFHEAPIPGHRGPCERKIRVHTTMPVIHTSASQHV